MVHMGRGLLRWARANRSKVMAGLLAFCIAGPHPVFCADSDLEKARMAARQGNALEMEYAFRRVLNSEPDNQEARIGLANALAWQGKHEEAQAYYKKVLSLDSSNLGALIGLGYSYAWNQQFDQAEKAFSTVLDIDSANAEAIKGLGYTYLWSGDHERAEHQFMSLSGATQQDAEAEVALGKIDLARGEPVSAATHFGKALDAQPQRIDALDGLRTARGQPTPIELQFHVGNTSNGGDTGLRYAEAATWFNNQKTRAWASYDNSLSLDNPALARSGEDAQTYRMGASHQFGERWVNQIELGYRDLPANADQDIYKIETAYVGGTPSLKVGVQISPHSTGYDDRLVYTGLGIAVAQRVRLEPTLYLARSGALKDEEWRFVLGAEYQAPTGWDAYGAIGYGEITSDVASATGKVETVTTKLRMPLSGLHSLLLSLHYEHAPLTEHVVAMLGLSLKF